MRTEQAARFFILALLAVVLYLLYLIFKPFLPAIAWAIFFATAFYPVYEGFVRILRGRQWAAAILTTMLVAALIVLPGVLIVFNVARNMENLLSVIEDKVRASPVGAALPPPTGQTGEGMANPQVVANAEEGEAAPSRLEPAGPAEGDSSGGAGSPAAAAVGPAVGPADASRDASVQQPAVPPAGSAPPRPVRFPVVARVEGFLGRYIDVSRLDLEGRAVSTIEAVGQMLARQATSLLQNVVMAVLSFVIMVLTMIFMLREGPRFLAACHRFLPLSQKDRDEVFKLLHEVTRAVFYGVMMTALLQALTGTIGWIIVGLPSPITFGIAMLFCAFLPIGGTALVWGPGAVYLFFNGHPGKAIFLALWGVLLVGVMDNVLRPLFMSRSARMHSLLVFFGIFGGMAAFGFVGLFVGPMVIALALFLFDVVRRDLFHPDRPPADPPSSAGGGTAPLMSGTSQ